MIHKQTLKDLQEENKRFKMLFEKTMYELVKANNKIAKLEEELRQLKKD